MNSEPSFIRGFLNKAKIRPRVYAENISLVRIVETLILTSRARSARISYFQSGVLSKFATFPEKDILLLFIPICIYVRAFVYIDPRSGFDAALGCFITFRHVQLFCPLRLGKRFLRIANLSI